MPREMPEGLREKWGVSRTEYERRLAGDANWQRLKRLVAETHLVEYGQNRTQEEGIRLMVQEFGQVLIDAVEQRNMDPWRAICREYGIDFKASGAHKK